MKIKAEFGADGSFAEFYLMDYEDDVVYLGHDGPAHLAIFQDRVKLVPISVYHGKSGKGLSIHMTLKHSPFTLLSIAEGNDDIYLLLAEGESVPGLILETGNWKHKQSLLFSNWSKRVFESVFKTRYISSLCDRCRAH